MPISPIADYAMPVTVPPDRTVDWALDPVRAALLVHDMQRYFIEPYGDGTLVGSMTERIAALIDAARRRGIPVVFTGQPPCQTPTDRGLNLDLWGPGMTRDRDAEFVHGIRPIAGDTVIMKRRYSAFHDSSLERVLAEHARDQLLITGVYASYGCVVTAQHAFMLGIKPFVLLDAMADFTPTEHNQAGVTIAATCGGFWGVDEILPQL